MPNAGPNQRGSGPNQQVAEPNLSASKPSAAKGKEKEPAVFEREARPSAATGAIASRQKGTGLRALAQQDTAEEAAPRLVLGAKIEMTVEEFASVCPAAGLRAVANAFRPRRQLAQQNVLETFDDQEVDDVVYCSAAAQEVYREDEVFLPAGVPSHVMCWSRACPVIEVFVPALKRKVRSLIDPGSQITVVDTALAAEASWPREMYPGWNVRTACGSAALKAACPRVELIVADVSEIVHVFVQDNLGYGIILGQNWRAQTRNVLRCNTDGSETTTIRAHDGRVLEIPCVRADDVVNQVTLRLPPGEHRDAWVENLDSHDEPDFY
jgi:hypothetical protein